MSDETSPVIIRDVAVSERTDAAGSDDASLAGARAMVPRDLTVGNGTPGSAEPNQGVLREDTVGVATGSSRGPTRPPISTKLTTDESAPSREALSVLNKEARGIVA